MLLVKADHRISGKDGSTDTSAVGCGLLGIGQKIDSSKGLKSITLDDAQGASSSFQPNIVAITLVP